MEDSFQEIIMTPSPESATPGPTQFRLLFLFPIEKPKEKFCPQGGHPLDPPSV